MGPSDLCPLTVCYIVISAPLNTRYVRRLDSVVLSYKSASLVKYRQTYIRLFFVVVDVLLTVHLSIVFISVINQLDTQNFCFTIILFHASTCFEYMCLSSGGQNCITRPLVSSHL